MPLLFFRPPRISEREPETGRQRLTRLLFLIAACLAVAWGFSRYSQRISDAVDTAAPADATKTLTRAQEDSLRAYTARFQERYGFPIVIRIRDRPFAEEDVRAFAGKALRVSGQEPAAQVLFLGICPAERQIVMHVPPLAGAILGEELVNRLRDAHFVPYFTTGNWPEGLAAALNAITRRLEASLRDGHMPLSETRRQDQTPYGL